MSHASIIARTAAQDALLSDAAFRAKSEKRRAATAEVIGYLYAAEFERQVAEARDAFLGRPVKVIETTLSEVA